MTDQTGVIRFLLCLAVVALSSCGSSPAAPAAPGQSNAVSFSYAKVDGTGDLVSSQLLGAPTILILVSTWDVASQAEARFVSTVLLRHDRPVHAAAIFLEPRDNQPLVMTFRDTLGLRYPLAFGDQRLIEGDSPLGSVSVPMTILLDRDGRIAWRQAGLAKDTDIEQALRAIEGR